MTIWSPWSWVPGSNPIWIATQGAKATLMLMNGPSGNASYLWGDASKGLPDSLMGHPIFFTDKQPAVGTIGDLILADLRYYIVLDRQAVSVDTSEHEKFNKNQTSLRIIERVEGAPWLSTPITLSDGSTTVSPFVQIATQSGLNRLRKGKRERSQYTFSERNQILDVLHAASQGAGTVNGNWVKADRHERIVCIADVGVISASGTFDLKLQQANTSGGGGAKDITGKAITRFTQAGGGGTEGRHHRTGCRQDGHRQRFLCPFRPDRSGGGSVRCSSNGRRPDLCARAPDQLDAGRSDQLSSARRAHYGVPFGITRFDHTAYALPSDLRAQIDGIANRNGTTCSSSASTRLPTISSASATGACPLWRRRRPASGCSPAAEARLSTLTALSQ